jgi:hypothetical protein
MGGWVCFIDDPERISVRSERLRRVFAIEGMPPLKIETHKYLENFQALLWAWSSRGVRDVFVKEDRGMTLLAAGAITDLGSLSSLPPTQEMTVERILDHYLDKSDTIIDQINGSFSLIFHDCRLARTAVFVDRFASRSVWVGREGKSTVIGNFPAAMAAVGSESPRLDAAGLWSFFHAGRQVGRQGLYSGMTALMAGQKAIIERSGQTRISSWWKREYKARYGLSSMRWGERLADALTTSARRYRNISGSPHLFLSGGLDSRIAAAALGQPLKTVSLCTQPNAETGIASRVSRILGLDHQIIVRSPYWYHDTMSASSLIGSGLYLNQHAHFVQPVQQVTSQDGASEFLLGDMLENFNKHYFTAPKSRRLSFDADSVIEVLYHRAPYRIGHPDRFGRHFRSEIRKGFQESYRAALSDFVSSIRNVSSEPEDCYDTLFRWANVGVTPTFNMITCIWPLAGERNIALDNVLNDASLEIPAGLRGKGILHRWILYHLNKRLVLVPDANTFLPPAVTPKARVITKRVRPWLGRIRRIVKSAGTQNARLLTSGSWLILHEMYRRDARYRAQIESLIFDGDVFLADIFDHDEIRRTWTQYLEGNIGLHFEIEALRSFGSLQRLTPFGRIDC